MDAEWQVEYGRCLPNDNLDGVRRLWWWWRIPLSQREYRHIAFLFLEPRVLSGFLWVSSTVNDKLLPSNTSVVSRPDALSEFLLAEEHSVCQWPGDTIHAWLGTRIAREVEFGEEVADGLELGVEMEAEGVDDLVVLIVAVGAAERREGGARGAPGFVPNAVKVSTQRYSMEIG